MVWVSRLDPQQFFVDEARSFTSGSTLYSVGLWLAMVSLSFDTTQAWVGRRTWRSVHWLASLGFWVSFAVAYGNRALTQPYYVPFAALLLLTLGLRIAAFASRSVSRGRPAVA